MESKVQISSPSWKEQGYLPTRYVVTLLTFFGHLSNYMLRVNMNFSILAMVQARNHSESIEVNTTESKCGFKQEIDDVTEDYNGPFPWNELDRGIIISSFYWGYLCTQILGGRLAEVIGGRLVFGGSILAAAVFTLLVPIAAENGIMALAIVRILIGLAQGPTGPCNYAIVSLWAPPLERTRMTSLMYSGSFIGTVITFPFSALLIKTIGWEYVFYVQASMTLVWVCAWFYFVPKSPRQAKTITEVERNYIISTIGKSKSEKTHPVPWRKMMTSMASWAIILAVLGGNWGFYTLLTDMPLYMKHMLKQDIKSNAILSSLPYLSMWMFSLGLGFTGDYLRSTNTITTAQLRKTATALAHLVPAICLVSLSFVECSRGITLFLFFVAVTFQGGLISGYAVNPVDITPNFAATLAGISNFAGAISAFLAPLTVGALTNNNQTFVQWNKVFYLAAVLYVLDTIFYTIFGRGEEQSWNAVSDDVQKDKNTTQDIEGTESKI